MITDYFNASETQIEMHSVLSQPSKAAQIDIADNEKSQSRMDNKSNFQGNDQTNYVPWQRVIVIFLTCASVDMVALIDQTTLAVSLPIIASALDASAQTSWIANGYFVTSTSFQLLYGRLSDIWSRKVVLLSGLFIFFLGSLAASLAQTSMQLILFRAFTGVGGGGLMTVAQIIVSDVVTLRERGKYQGILGAVVALSNGVGPVIGGVLASQSKTSWRWIFRLNLPLTALTTCCVVFYMPLKKVDGNWQKKLQMIDFVGVLLTLAGSTTIVLGLTWAGGQYQWQSTHVIATVTLGIFIFIIFIMWQWKGSKIPLVPLHIFKSQMVIGACLTMFINGWNFVVQIYFIPLFYQLSYGYSPVKAGTLLLPLVLVQALSSTFSGLIVTWRGRYRESIVVGWTLWAVGLGLFSTLNTSSGAGMQIGYALLTGLGAGQTLQPSLIAIQAGVNREDMAVVTGTRSFVRNLGAAMGLAVAGSISTNSLRTAFLPLNMTESRMRDILNQPGSFREGPKGSASDLQLRAAILSGYHEGFQIIFILGASLAAFGGLVALLLMPELGLDRKDDDELKREAKTRIETEKAAGEGEALKSKEIKVGEAGKEEQIVII